MATKLREIPKIEGTNAPDPPTQVIQLALEAQSEDRFVVLENGAIDGAFGVWDDEFEMWTAQPFHSEIDAMELKRRAKARD